MSPSLVSFLDRFERQVDRLRSECAITFEGRSVSYGQLDEQSSRLAHHLIDVLCVTPDSVVAICGERSPETLIALLAVLKAGAGYLPLDSNYPAERIRFMLTDSKARVLIREPGLLSDLTLEGLEVFEFSSGHSVVLEGNAERLSRRHVPSGLAYAIYTSGSTGVPKGVAMVHQALDNLIEWQLSDSSAGVGTVTLQFAPLSFDVHFQEIFSTWCSGGRLVLVREQLRLEMLRLIDVLENEKVERLFLPFIALQSLADIAVAHGRLPASLREVVTAGEQLQITRSIREFFSRLPSAKLFNHYGPSETHVVTSLQLQGSPETWPALPAIGSALPNVSLIVLGEDGNPVPAGNEGELLIGGIALAQGYLYRPELTAERFVERANVRYYRTGDLVRELPSGDYQFLGRIDGQVKIRGYRVELGEIEVALSAHSNVREAAATVQTVSSGEKRLLAYVVLETGTDLVPIREAIRNQLPEYMVPSALMVLERLPRTPSGKVDKRSLPAPTRDRPALSTDYVAPSAGLASDLALIWRELLELDAIGANDNFFELGGNSLLALRAVAEVERRFGKVLSIVRFFEYPTLGRQAQFLSNPSAFTALGTRRVAHQSSRANEPIAVIGMAGRFPGAASVGELWNNIIAGIESVETFRSEDLADLPDEERTDPAYVPVRGVIRDIECFDASLFGIGKTEAAVLDPQQRQLLELSWSALENAGYAPTANRQVVGVYAGVHNNSYYSTIVSRRPDAAEQIGSFATMAANEKDYVATRIANRLDLTGPALSIHTACSTSLVAIATAVQQLRAGMCDMAIAGGAALTIPQRHGHVYQEGGMFSSDGTTRAFDAGATGTVFSDGAAVVVLKPLSAAIADRDTIYAVVRGVGLNNDGGSKASFTAPSVEGQAAAIAMAHDDAGVSPRDIQYVETHGTATPLGDPIEVAALTQAFHRTTTDRGFCGIGSLKTNVGHMTVAAGVGGFIKAALSLYREEIPPSLHYSTPNPKISIDQTPFFVVSERKAWPRGKAPRYAGVSAFGVGGTNAHLVLEEPPLAGPSGPAIAPQLLLVSAKSKAARERIAASLATRLSQSPSLNLADAAYTLSVGRSTFPERRFVVASSAEEAARKLQQATTDLSSGRADGAVSEVVFLFPGQGSQYVGMGKNLYEGGGLFRLVFDQCAELLLPLIGKDLRRLLFAAAEDPDSVREELKRTEVTQPALFAIEYSLGRQLIEWGIRPTVMVGHSIGEFPAACLAGIFTLESALKVVVRRGQVMQSMAPGSMLSIRDNFANVQGYLPGELDLATVNSPELCVVSGATEAIANFASALSARGISAKLLETSHGFHSRSMEEAARQLAAELRSTPLAAPKIPIVSTATGTWLTDQEAQDPEYWANQLRQPVQFMAAMATIATGKGRLLLEVGPRRTLSTLAMQQPENAAGERHRAITCLADRAEDDAEWTALLTAVGRLWSYGINIDIDALYRGEDRRRIALPGYSFERERHWLDAPPTTRREPTTQQTDAVHLAPADQANPMTVEATRVNHQRRDKLIVQLMQLFEQTSGSDFSSASPTAHFMELGIDSLLVTQIALRVKQTFKVAVTFRQLMEDVPTFNDLANYLDERLPPEPIALPAAVASPAAVAAAPLPAVVAGSAVPMAANQAVAPLAFGAPIGAPIGGESLGGSLAITQQLIQLQMAQLALLQQQFGVASASMSSAQVPVATAQVPAIALSSTGAALAVGPEAVRAAAPLAEPAVASSNREVTKPNGNTKPLEGEGTTEGGQVKYDPQKAFGAIARIYKQSDALTPKQLARLDQLTERYCRKTGKSKSHTQEHRNHHADPRVVTGFKPRIKEIIYPIVTSRALGCRLWDLDGNEYIDALNGFGSNYFGYSAKFIADALHARIDQGIEIGPQTTLAGDSAAIVCELTGMDRAAFCNTGSEAVMGALRIARTVTGRNLVVAFSGSYHGIFDEVIVRDTKTMRSVPAAPGILPEAVQNILVLEYGTDKSLEIIRGRAEEIAAVLVEPVQSRRPDFRPQQFLTEVREITQRSGTALIFDEVITGFRIHPGGAQVFYNIKSDLATYGKVVGGGMPIGVIAGRNPWMDALDGGQWRYGDDSIPTAGVTYFAGTFVRHPLAMAAAHAALLRMKAEGPALQERINSMTTQMATDLNSFFKSVGAPLEIRHFASLWKTFFTEVQPYGELLFCYLRDRGLHIWDGFPCFLTDAHGKAEVDFIIESFKSAVREMQAGDFLPGGEKEPARIDANSPPVPNARLGRDANGNPAWYVPDPAAPGKYTQLS